MHTEGKRENETGREYAIRCLTEGIVSLRFAPGSIISEPKIAEQLGLSRTPVREALIELSRTGVAEIRPKRSSRVSLIDPRLVDEAAFIRLAMDSAIIPEVCARANAFDYERLEALIERQERAGEEPEFDAFQALDNEFHHALYTICGKELCYRTAFNLNIHFERLRYMRAHFHDNADLIAEHRAILRAIREQDVVRARDLSAKHILRYRSDMSGLQEAHPEYFPRGTK